MNILEEIVANKKKEVAGNMELYPTKLLEKSIYFQAAPVSLRKYMLRPDLHGIIAEFKRKSPSRGMINEFASPSTVCLGYMQAGASALSVLTDSTYFGGSKNDLLMARRNNYCPILRKDFIIDEYQVIESRSIGADAILLIADILPADRIKSLFELASSLGMEVLFEIHGENEIDRLPVGARVVGVNSRNLRSFQVDADHAASLAGKLPAGVIKVAESGIDSPDAYNKLRDAGYCGFLIGERFMREANPAKACQQFINAINRKGPCR